MSPSLPCTPKPRDALALLACSDQTLARADIRFVQTYYALRASPGADLKQLRSEFLSFVVQTRQECGLPPVEPDRDQSGVSVPQSAAACVAADYDGERDHWLVFLRGSAAEEANRAPEANVALQARLQATGYLPSSTMIDGIFGTGVREAISRWQRASGRPDTGFLGDSDAAALLGTSTPAPAAAVASTVAPDLPVGDPAQPLAAAAFQDKPLSITAGAIRVAITAETSLDSKVCDKAGGDLFGDGSPDVEDLPHLASCRILMTAIVVSGKEVFSTRLATLDDDLQVDTLAAKVSIRRLDPTTGLPQVVFTGYTGGAHCCFITAILTTDAEGRWHGAHVPDDDSDSGFGFITAGDGSAALVEQDSSFAYEFSGYPGSLMPTRIYTLKGLDLHDATRDRPYGEFLSRELGGMEIFMKKNWSSDEVNGFLAGWVAEKSLVGQFDDAWRTMLANYDHDGDQGPTECRVDERVWPVVDRARMCPDDQSYAAPFPESLAIFLVQHGYITNDQAASVGLDVEKILADRKAAVETATDLYDPQGWYGMGSDETCTNAGAPRSPAELIAADRARGLEDSYDVQERDDDGKPTVVLVDQPEAGEMEREWTFFKTRGLCEGRRQERHRELEELK